MKRDREGKQARGRAEARPANKTSKGQNARPARKRKVACSGAARPAGREAGDGRKFVHWWMIMT